MDAQFIETENIVDDYARIERALSFLQENFYRQPALQEIAASVSLSEFHFQRLFSRWVGISPKRFLQFLTKEYAKELLAKSIDLLEVTYMSGLSSPGRLHDLFVTCEAVTPGEFKNSGAGLRITYGFHSTQFGECLLAATERGICGLNFVQEGDRHQAVEMLRSRWSQAEISEDPAFTIPYVNRIFAISQQPASKPLSLFLKGTNFQIKVWEALLRIPPGALVSYESIARSIGAPLAARAVGNAVAKNPIQFIIPCHRVIHKMGDFGYYQGGAARKLALVGWEAAHAQAWAGEE